MQQAISLYNGGQLIEAEDVDYDDYLDRGFCCPVCGSAVFLTKGFNRGTVPIATHFKHHKGSGLFCESRAKSPEYKQFLAKFTSKARGQRLTVFNDRFWRIYKYQKDLPPNFREIYQHPKIKEMARHCHKLWDVDRAIASLDKYKLNKESVARSLKIQGLEPTPDLIQKTMEIFKPAFDPTNQLITAEVIRWLSTESAFPSFTKVVALASADLADIKDPPWHSNDISNVALKSLAATDWERAIKSVRPKSKGFAQPS